MERVDVDLGAKSYKIHIGENILAKLGDKVRGLVPGDRLLLVTNPTVRELCGEMVVNGLVQAGYEVTVAEVPDGEQYKTPEMALRLYDSAFDARLDRQCGIVALGGGVIGDLAGFVAATFMRGVHFIQVPTTLLAQVDSSVGGKVAVNHPRGKNIIGSFYQPRLVFGDIGVLRSLPEREFRAGMAEVIKYGIIWDTDFFNFLEHNQDRIKSMETRALEHIVKASCYIKARVVEQDETEQGLRAILNLGHTFGHAFEALTHYREYVHGEAVAIGMVSAARVAAKMGLLKTAETERIEALIKAFGLPVNFTGLSVEDIIESMYHDKKVLAGKIRFIIPDAIGRAKILPDVPAETIREVLAAQQV
jgi:3-dehydroquinate synthase